MESSKRPAPFQMPFFASTRVGVDRDNSVNINDPHQRITYGLATMSRHLSSENDVCNVKKQG